MTSNMISLRIPPDLFSRAAARGASTSEGVRESLGRYFHLLDQARRQIRDRFTSEELTILVRLGSGTLFTAQSLEGLLWNARDAEPAEAGCSIEVKERLIRKLEECSLLEHAALVDAVERFWLAAATGTPVDPVAILDN